MCAHANDSTPATTNPQVEAATRSARVSDPAADPTRSARVSDPAAPPTEGLPIPTETPPVPETCGHEDGGVGDPRRAPEVGDAPRAEPAAEPKSGHGPGGRFVIGNPGGPGNPYARETARLRQEFRACAKPGDIQSVYD